MRNLTRHLPSCPRETASLPLPEITDKWLWNQLNHSPSTKATGEDGLNYEVLKLAGSSYLSCLRSCMHAILKNTTPLNGHTPVSHFYSKKKTPETPKIIALSASSEVSKR